MRRTFWLLVITLMAIAIAQPVHARQGASSPPPNPIVTNAPALLIKIQDSQYVPASATVKIGESIQFENDDPTGHTVTASDGSFDSGYLGKGESWRTTFSQARTFLYSDIYHPAMHGSITVVVN